MCSYVIALTLFYLTPRVLSLNNGLALTPPMGWSTWMAYACKTCEFDYDTKCMNEKNIRDIADLMISQGYARLGYQLILLDDCWQSKTRDPFGWLMADPDRFPSGIPELAKYIHDRNLKLGLFSDLGPQTGQGRPGTADHYIEDSATFAQWKADYVKMSGCSANPTTMEYEYRNFGFYLQQTGRPMVYATSWPVYQLYKGLHINYDAVSATCNTWRFYGDAINDWSGILEIVDNYAKEKNNLTRISHPGSWNDADLLVIGMGRLTVDQSKAQMALWAVIPSPLIIGADLREISSEFRDILLNEEVIKINQDSLGKPGTRFGKAGEIDVWKRCISPNTIEGECSYAIAFVYRAAAFTPIPFSVTLTDLDLKHSAGYHVTDLFPTPNSLLTPYNRQFMTPSSTLTMQINPQGVAFFKAELVINPAPLISVPPTPWFTIIRD